MFTLSINHKLSLLWFKVVIVKINKLIIHGGLRLLECKRSLHYQCMYYLFKYFSLFHQIEYSHSVLVMLILMSKLCPLQFVPNSMYRVLGLCSVFCKWCMLEHWSYFSIYCFCQTSACSYNQKVSKLLWCRKGTQSVDTSNSWFTHFSLINTCNFLF